MAQFDLLIISPLLWSLLLVLFLHYKMLLNTISPNFFGVKKFREKKSGHLLFNNFSKLSVDFKNILIS